MPSEMKHYFVEGRTEAQRIEGQKVHLQVLKGSKFLQCLGPEGCLPEVVSLRVCMSHWLQYEQWLLSNFEMMANYSEV